MANLDDDFTNYFYEIGKNAAKKVTQNDDSILCSGIKPIVQQVPSSLDDLLIVKNGQISLQNQTKIIAPDCGEFSAPCDANLLEVPDMNECVKERSLGKALLKLTDSLEKFICNAYSTTPETSNKLQLKHLKLQLIETLELMSTSSNISGTLSFPFENLITICDVYNCRKSVWNRNESTIESAKNIMLNENLIGICCTALLDMPLANGAVSNLSQNTLNYCYEPVLVQLCKVDGSIGKLVCLEEKFLETGCFLKDVSTKMTSNMSTITLNFIKMHDACHFWAYIGVEHLTILDALEKIYDDYIFSKERSEDAYVTNPPQKNDIMIIKTENASLGVEFNIQTSFLRVLVVDIMGTKALLWCIDFATHIIQDWHLLCECPEEMLRFPHQAKLCEIAGLVAKPSVEVVVNSCVFLLKFLAHWSFEFDEKVLSEFFVVFLRLSKSTIRAIRIPSLLCICIGATIVGFDKQKSIQFNILIRTYVDCISQVLVNSVNERIGDELTKEIVIATQAVRNILFNFTELQKYFAEIGGFPVVMKLLLTEHLDETLNLELWKFLRVLIGTADFSKEEIYNDNKGVPTSNPSISTRAKPELVLPRKSIKYLLQEKTITSWNEKEEEKSVVSEASGAASLKHGTTLSAVPREDVKSREYFIKGKVFNLQPSDNTIIVSRRTINSIVNVDVIKTVCALLNSGSGGSIYFGIDSNNVVQGINVVRKQRDDIRTGFDDLFARYFIPKIAPDMCKIIYVKVFGANEPRKFESVTHALYVIKLEVKEIQGNYFKVSDNKSGQYFVISNGVAKKACTQEMREKIISQAEKQWI